MLINRKDVIWNYAATFLKIGSSILLLPFILRMMPAEMVGIWSIFITITSFVGLLDFGFNPSFARNVTYIFCGVSALKTSGFESVENENITVDYGLLKGVIKAMRWFYLRMAIILFLFLTTIGTFYISTLMQAYKGEQQPVYLAWALFCVINTYNLFTLYYDSLLQGKGLIKRSKQITIIGQTIYLIIAALLIIAGNGLVAIVAAQASSVLIVRWLSHHSFFTIEIKQKLQNAVARSKKEILKAIYPNALKIGLTSFSGFLVQKSSIVIGALYLSLEEIASYGITMQLISIIASMAGIYTATYQPKIAQLRVTNDHNSIKELYLRGQFIMCLTYLISGLMLILFGEWALSIIHSKTLIMPIGLLVLALVLSFEETNLIIAGGILLTKNEVPFFRAALISGGCIVTGLFVSFQYLKGGLICMLLVPLIIDFLYQTWKWPYEVIKELKISIKDIVLIFTKY